MSPGLAEFLLRSWCVSISCVLGPDLGMAQLRFGWIQGFAEVPAGVKPGHQTPIPSPLSVFPYLCNGK